LIDSKLSALQTDLLHEFFRYEQGFFLSGGAALAGFLLGHRSTTDLDLFCASNRLDDGDRALRQAAEGLGATLENIQTTADFRRRLVRRGSESVLVDLVHERVPQGSPEKLSFGEIRIDPPQKILANKLCTLLSRSEVRDLVDVMLLERAGFSIEQAFPLAQAKDGGLTPAQLAWVLSEIRVGDDARIPGGVSAPELREFIDGLRSRMARLGFPHAD
jgi:predicted nucleotidyltransferase component of viral defense system